MRVRLVLAVLLASGVSLTVGASPGSTQPCEGVDCVTDPAAAVVCIATGERDDKYWAARCLTQPA